MYTDLFPIRIFRSKLEVNSVFLKLKPEIDRFQRDPTASHPDIGINAFTTYNGGNNLHKEEYTKELVDQLMPMVNEYWKELHLHDKLIPHIDEMWVNVSRKDNSVIGHNHLPYLMNGVVYLKKSADSGNIVFENPSSLIVCLQPLGFSGSTDVAYNIEREIAVETGDVLIFPGWLRHRTRTNITDDERVVLSFNVGCTGHYPTSSYVVSN